MVRLTRRDVCPATPALPAGGPLVLAVALGAVALLGGCGSAAAPSSGTASDPDSARLIARDLADSASCEGLEDHQVGDGWWDFTCSTPDGGSYLIRAVDSPETGEREAAVLSEFGPLKAGEGFLVQEGRVEGEEPRGLQAFPGQPRG